MKPSTPTPDYDQTIAGRGLRMTEQRRSVYEAVMARGNHPTAVEVFMQVKGTVPSISLATVYNCLETLTECGLVRHVHHERESSRYCANLEEHAHLFCESCGSVTDLPLRVKRRAEDLWEMPEGSVVTSRDVSFRGICPACVEQGVASQALLPKIPKRRFHEFTSHQRFARDGRRFGDPEGSEPGGGEGEGSCHHGAEWLR